MKKKHPVHIYTMYIIHIATINIAGHRLKVNLSRKGLKFSQGYKVRLKRKFPLIHLKDVLLSQLSMMSNIEFQLVPAFIGSNLSHQISWIISFQKIGHKHAYINLC